jgi:hypothetical protein
MSPTTLGCAQNPDGSLRDASEIEFFNDVDDENPIAGPGSSTLPPLAPIFTRAKPVGKVAGARRPSPRRSSRTSHPSSRLIDPNNAETSKTGVKRRLESAPGPRPRKAPRVDEPGPADSSDTESDTAFDAPATDPATEGETDGDVEEKQDSIDAEEYESIKAMADADHAHVEVLLFHAYSRIYLFRFGRLPPKSPALTLRRISTLFSSA